MYKFCPGTKFLCICGCQVVKVNHLLYLLEQNDINVIAYISLLMSMVRKDINEIYVSGWELPEVYIFHLRFFGGCTLFAIISCYYRFA